MNKDSVCPVDGSDPFAAKGCELFPDCPPADEMSACRQLNLDNPRTYNKKACEEGFAIVTEGRTVTVPRKRCAYANGLCRAIGDYWYGRKTMIKFPGYWDKIRGCPYLA